MFITKETTIESLKQIQDGVDLKLTKEVVLNKDLLVFILQNFPNSNITILSGFSNKGNNYSSFEYLYNEDEIKILLENTTIAREKYKKELTFDELFSVEEALSASRQINNIVSEISSANVEGQKLSNLEKFLYAYTYVVNRVYMEEKDSDNPQVSRNPIGVLNGDKIVCAGFATLLFTILNKLEIPCTLQAEGMYDFEKQTYTNHLSCCVRIEDDKYNKHGIYYSNPTFDYTRHTTGYGGKKVNILTFDHALIPYDKIKEHEYYKDRPPIKIDKSMQANYNPDFLFDGYDSPKVLSYLFPEKTAGKSQDVLIYEHATNTINNSNVNRLIDDTINSITSEMISENTMLFASKLANVSKFVSLIDKKSKTSFESALEYLTHTLVSYGYTKEEISKFLKSTLTIDAIMKNISEQLEHLSNSCGINPDCDANKKYLTESLKYYNENIPNIEKIINSLNLSDIAPADATNLISMLSSQIVDASINVACFNQKQVVLMPEVVALQRQGFSFEDILKRLKKQSTDIDKAKRYIRLYPEQNVYLSSLKNEKEFFMNFPGELYLFNTPYEEDFAKLVKQATYLSGDEAFNALTNIFRSQGNKTSFAEWFADEILKQSYTL